MLVLACGWAEIHMELLTILLGFLISAGLTALIIPRIILISSRRAGARCTPEPCRGWAAWPFRPR